MRTEDWAVIDPFAWRITYATGFHGFPHDAWRIIQETSPDSVSGPPLYYGMLLALMEGRAEDVARLVAGVPLMPPDCPTCDFSDLLPIPVAVSAFFVNGFEEAAGIAVQRIAPHVQLDPEAFNSAMCLYQLWRLDRDDDVAATRAMLEAAGSAEPSDSRRCLALAAALEARDDPSGPAPKLERLDSLMAAGWHCTQTNLLIADLLSARGEFNRALAVVRRRRGRAMNVCGAYQQPAFLVREGRLAAMLGDTAGAIAAYDHYLRLRTNPDSGVLMEEQLAVQRHLAELVGEGGRE